MIDTKSLFRTMSLSMFATPYKEAIQKIYDEQKAAGMLDVEEGEFEEGIQFLMPLMTVEQEETLRKIEDHYHIMWDYAAEHGFLCGVVHAFERFFASGNDYHYDFTDSTWRSLYQPQFGYQHKSYCQAASEIRRLLDKLDEQLDESGQYHLISIELGYDQRVYSATLNAFYVGYLAVAELIMRIDPSATAKILAQVLLFELHWGFRGKPWSFLDKVNYKGEVIEHGKS